MSTQNLRVDLRYIAQKWRTKSSFIYNKLLQISSRLIRTITRQKIKVLVLTHRDRDKKERDFRGLGISLINAVIEHL